MIVVREIPITSLLTRSRNSLSNFPRFGDFTFLSVDGGSLTVLIGSDIAMAHRYL